MAFFQTEFKFLNVNCDFGSEFKKKQTSYFIIKHLPNWLENIDNKTYSRLGTEN